MKSLFGWHASASTSHEDRRTKRNAEACTLRHANTGDIQCQSDQEELAARFWRICGGSPEAHTFLRPLMGITTLIQEALRIQNIRANPLLSQFVALLEFLAVSENSLQHLNFALSAHVDYEEAELHLTSVEAFISALSKSKGKYDDQSFCEAAVAKWRMLVQDFFAKCQEVWELYLYLIFVDIKGDQVLFDEAIRRLCRLLKCSMRTMVGSLPNTKKHAQDALRRLSRFEHLELMEKLHADALIQWRVGWQERVAQMLQRHRLSGENLHGHKFWESYFIHLYKISWPDFVEAFEDFYLGGGRCPVDLVGILRRQVDPRCIHQVSRLAWTELLEKHSKIVDIMDMLVGEVLKDITSWIYRREPLERAAGIDEAYEQSQACEFQAISRDQTQISCPEQSAGGMPAPPLARCPRGGAGSAFPAAGNSSPPSTPVVWTATNLPTAAPAAAASNEDGDMAIATPHYLQMSPGASSAHRPTIPWQDYVAWLCSQSHPWWCPIGEYPGSVSKEDKEPLRVAALRAVESSLSYTRNALVFRVVSGELEKDRPILKLPKKCPTDSSSEGPSLVINANGTRFSSVTKFGRSSSRRTLIPDCPMTEPIASRSHFSVVYDQDTDRYYLMDAGSKWGTFVKITSSIVLSCGDWIRVGGVEFIIRYCGGGCACRKRHVHYKLHLLRLLKDQQATTMRQASSKTRIPPPTRSIRSRSEGDVEFHHEPSGTSGSVTSAYSHLCLEADTCADSSSEDDRPQNVHDEMLLLLSSRRPRGWITTSAHLCQQRALHGSFPLPVHHDSTSSSAQVSSPSSSSRSTGFARATSESQPQPTAHTSSAQATSVPVAPLELDFISGPRMGEKLVLCERVCTLGRGEGNTIQVSDTQLTSVSRVHCIFEYTGNRWRIRDNGSTNGTWRRLSCVLEPSLPIPITSGVSIQAGVHDFFVEEAEMPTWWIPSLALPLCEDNRSRKHPGVESERSGSASAVADAGESRA